MGAAHRRGWVLNNVSDQNDPNQNVEPIIIIHNLKKVIHDRKHKSTSNKKLFNMI